MSGFTESSNSDPPALVYFNQAMDAFDGGAHELSEELCRKAATLYEQEGIDEVSAVYRQLGLIAYWRADCDASEQWYRKSLEIDEKNGNERGAAKTFHYLGATANVRESVTFDPQGYVASWVG